MFRPLTYVCQCGNTCSNYMLHSGRVTPNKYWIARLTHCDILRFYVKKADDANLNSLIKLEYKCPIASDRLVDFFASCRIHNQTILVINEGKGYDLFVETATDYYPTIYNDDFIYFLNESWKSYKKE